MLLSVITSFSQDGCLIFLVFLTNCKKILIFFKFRPKKAITSSYEAAEPSLRLVSQVIKSICDFPKTRRNRRNWRRYEVAMASCGIDIVHYSKYNLSESISSCWLSLNKIYGTKQEGKSCQQNRRKKYLFHEKLLISRTRRNFAFLKTWPCRELNLEGGHVLRFLI